MALHVAVFLILALAGVATADSECMYYTTQSYRSFDYFYSTYRIAYRTSPKYQTCSDRCCDDASEFQVCCYGAYYYDSSYGEYSSWSVAPIVGIVIGSLVGLGLFITLAICCCARASKRSNRPLPGRPLQSGHNIAVIQANTGQPVTYPYSGIQSSYPAQMIGYNNAGFYNPSEAPPPSYETVMHNNNSHGGTHYGGDSLGGGLTPGGCDIGGGGFSGGGISGGGCDSGGGGFSGGGSSGGGCDSGGGGGGDCGGGGF